MFFKKHHNEIRPDSEHFLSITNHLRALSKGNKKMLFKGTRN